MDNRTGGVGARGRAVWRGARRPALIGVDCDGVLASDRLLWRRLRAGFPEHIPARYDDLATFEWPRATAETAALCLQLSSDPAFAQRLEPIPGMIRGLRSLWAAGYRIQILTARPACVRTATWRWLRRYGVAEYVEEIHCVAGGLEKVPLARELGCVAFVEDNHATAERMGEAGIRSYLLDAPYNRFSTLTSTRVAGWSELLDLLLNGPVVLPEVVALSQAHMSAEANLYGPAAASLAS